MTKWVYGFGSGKAEGDAGMRALLGGKGANLAEMSKTGLPVPPGFTITTSVCSHYYSHAEQYPQELQAEVLESLKQVEEATGRGFGDRNNPLLVSVRSGAPISMPGMMDTVLNLGLNAATVKGLAEKSGDERFAYDSYRRFIQMYSDVVLGVDHYLFEEALAEIKLEEAVTFDSDLSATALSTLAGQYLGIVRKATGNEFPMDPHQQLWAAIGAVFSSWMSKRANTYRQIHNIDKSMGTAVTVQSMVFGNMGNDCATGVAFTRNPTTGENKVYGEFLINAQGEDVVAGIRTPNPLSKEMALEISPNDPAPSMEELMPKSYEELCAVFTRLERHYRDVQDIEFTIQSGKLYVLQTRSGKRTTPAALKIAVDMVAEGIISEKEAIERIDPASLDQLLHPMLDPDFKVDVFCKGLPASPGAVCGVITLSADEAVSLKEREIDSILVRTETSPDDIHGMKAAQGFVTAKGGLTSHAAVVARGMGKPCVCGAGDLVIDYEKGTIRSGSQTFKVGEIITIDGGNGLVLAGKVPTAEPNLSDDFAKIMRWADQYRRLKVRTNAETPEDATAALRFGAEGIGLCRTEHMFFQADRIVAMREMILAEDQQGRRSALAKLAPMQRGDFIQLFEIMKGKEVTIRLLDPPLHEFLPHDAKEDKNLAQALGIDLRTIKRRVAELRETNPMLGLRGCRLGVLFPEIPEMQAKAIIEAAAHVQKSSGDTVIPEIMVPLTATEKEFEILKAMIDNTARIVMEETGQKVSYLVGTMIEIPRAALRAGDIAKTADFFSFGTNDLTQMTIGLSRDDCGSFMDAYLEQEIFGRDPFQSVDQKGVGELVEIAIERGRLTSPQIKLGICGEHGGDPDSVQYCHQIGLDYVSCSPYRVPIARLAAAQAALAETVEVSQPDAA